MKKQHGRLVREWRDVKIFEDWHDPGFTILLVKRDIGKLKGGKIHSRMSADGWWFTCEDCKCEHCIPWDDVKYIEQVLHTHKIPRLLVFCLDRGKQINIWQPGMPRPKGKYKLLTWFELE